MKQKKDVILFIITVALSVLILCFFLTGYYSIDTMRIYSQGYTDYATKDAYIRDGRLFSALIFVMIGLVNPNMTTLYIVNLSISIMILSICVIQIYQLIERYKKLEKTKHKLVAFMLSYTYIFSFLIVDILKFIDSFIIATSILLFIIAIKKIVIERKNILGCLFTILGVSCYQGTIPVFIATACLLTVLENKKINKMYIKNILPCAISIMVGAIINLIIVKLIPVITGMEMTDRISEIDFIRNIQTNLLGMGEIVFESFQLFPPYTWIATAMTILILSIIEGIRKKEIEVPIYVLFIFIVYVASIGVIAPIQKFLIAPRVLLVLSQVISGMIIYIFCIGVKEEKTSIYQKLITCITVVYFLLTMISITKSTYECKKGNKIDETFTTNIENEIMNLEKQGIDIQAISIKYTGNYARQETQLVYESSIYLRGLYSANLYEFYTGRKIETQGFTREIEETYFENPSHEEVQFKHIGDVLYILVDL